MEPTPFCERLVRPVRTVLDALDQFMGHRNEFDPALPKRTFRICMTDISQLVLLPKLMKTLRVSAAGIRIEIFPLSGETGALLERGEADLALGFMPQLEAGFYQQLLFMQSVVCLVSSDHPRIQGQLSLSQFESEEHVVVSSSGAAPLVLDREIARLGIKRRIALQLPNFLGATFVVEQTHHIITIPQRLGEIIHGRSALQILPVPFSLPDYAVKQHWHERFHNDPGSRLLRGVIAGLLGADNAPAA